MMYLALEIGKVRLCYKVGGGMGESTYIHA